MTTENSFKLTYATMFNPPEELHQQFDAALAKLKANLGKEHGMIIDGKDIFSQEKIENRFPANMDVILGIFQKGTAEHAHAALATARKAFPGWSHTPWQERVALIQKAATLMEERIYEMGAVMAMAGGPESIVLAVYVGILGSLQGHALLLFAPPDAHRLAQILLAGLLGPGELPMESTADPLHYDELELSALQEAGNVTISAFLNELGMHLHEPVQPTPPQVVIEMAGAVLDAVLLDLVSDADQVLAARTTFSEGDRAIDGTLFVLPRADSLRVLLDALGAIGI